MESDTRTSFFRVLIVLFLAILGWLYLKEATTIVIIFILLCLFSKILMTRIQASVLVWISDLSDMMIGHIQSLPDSIVHCFLQLFEQLIGYSASASRRIILLGKTGSGKSSAGNTILGVDDAFHEEASLGSVTDECSVVSGDRFGQILHVIDTPGLFDTTKSFVENGKELFNSLSLAKPGPHVFILVVRIGQYSKEDFDAYKYFKTILKEEIFKTGILLFTHGDKIPRTSTLKNFIRETTAKNQYFKDLCKDFADRICVLNNKNREDGHQVKTLLEMIDRITNSGKVFTASKSFELKLSVLHDIEKDTTLDFNAQMAAFTKRMAELNTLSYKFRQALKFIGIGFGTAGVAVLVANSPTGVAYSPTVRKGFLVGVAAGAFSKLYDDIASFVSSKFKPKPKPKRD